MSTSATFRAVAELAEQLAAEGSRLRKRSLIAEAVGAAAAHSPESAGLFCLYLAGQPFAEADPRRLNAGGALLSKALKVVSGATDAAMTAAWRLHGDLGASAFDLLEAAGHQPTGEPVTLAEVAAVFDRMATASATKVRAEEVETLLRRGSALEAKYLLKLMLGDMRIGVKQSLVEEAIGVAAGAEVAAVRHAVMLEADLARAVRRAFAGTLGEARMTLFHPLGFMLASPVETPEEAMERFTPKPQKAEKPAKGKKRTGAMPVPVDELPTDSADEALAEDVEAVAAELSPTPGAGVEALIEDKFDGIRAQLHFGDAAQPGRVAIYSRSREDITEGFPDIAEAFRGFSMEGSPHDLAGGVILDGELMGWDLAADRALPFAVLGQRIGRKRVDNALRRQVPAVFMAFDLLCEADELTLPLPLTGRRGRLEALYGALSGTAVSPLELPTPPPAAKGRKRAHGDQGSLFAAPEAEPETDATPVARLRLSRAERAHSAEAIDRAYRDARERANEGVMLKAAASPYLPGRRGLLWVKLKRELGTLDVVITGAEYGTGRRAQLLSDYTFAVRGPDGELLNVGKAYSGVTDAEILELTAWLKQHTLQDFGHFRTVEPMRILEVAFNNIMRSDRHGSGFALRFPRILRLRDDKPLDEIDTLERVETIFLSQPDRPVDPAEA